MTSRQFHAIDGGSESIEPWRARAGELAFAITKIHEATHTGSVPLEKLPETIGEKMTAAVRTIADLRQSLAEMQREHDRFRAILEQIQGLRSSAGGAAYAYVGQAILIAISSALSGEPAKAAECEIAELRRCLATAERTIAEHHENTFLISIIGKIRASTGVGITPMLSELPEVLAEKIAAPERERDALLTYWHDEQLDIWADEIYGDLGPNLDPETHDDKVQAHRSIVENLKRIHQTMLESARITNDAASDAGKVDA